MSNIENLQFNPFTKIGKQWGLVSAGDINNCNTMTVSWGGVGVLWGKNVVYIFIRDSRYTKEFIDNGETFSLSFLGDEYSEAHSVCGSKSGRDCDKWKETGLTPISSEGTGVVYPKEAELVFLCKKLAAVPIDADTFIDTELESKWYSDHDMHMMYVGEIIETIEK